MQNDEDKKESWKNIALQDIDKLTLECLMNRTRYNKYVANTDPKRSAETEQYLANVKKYCSKIKDLTGDLLDDPLMPVTTEVNEMFDAYMKTLIKHFQTKELEKSNDYYNCDNDEEETLFGQMDDKSGVSPKMTSFWSGEQVIQKK
jgi:PP-loop superfamily ATP-utilizing enzyme